MNIGIIGLGLIGASLAKEFSNISHNVYGTDCDKSVVQRAIGDKVIVAELTRGCCDSIDILISAVYSGATIDAIRQYLPYLKGGTIVMDTAGNKRGICRGMTALAGEYPEVMFLGGHPMAGREVSGYDASRQGLFLGAKMLLVNINCPEIALHAVAKLYRDIGFMSPVMTTADQHDSNIAYTSQLAHILSNAYIKNQSAPCYKDFAAGSFRDLTRVAGMNVDMWAALMIENKDMVLMQLQEYMDNLSKVQSVLTCGDIEGLKLLIDKGNSVKKNLGL